MLRIETVICVNKQHQKKATKSSNNKIVKTNNENKYKITSNSETKQITKK
jgi:hypothetical protein